MAEYEKTPERQSIPWKGGKYAGHLRNNAPHGRGRFIQPDGTRYDGDWVEGMPNGRGTIIYAGGGLYKGDFVEGNRHGYGSYTLPDGKTYKGLWEKGKLINPLEKLRQDIEYERSAAGREPVNVRKGEPAIYVEKLNHWYGKLQAVKDISFEVYPGEILGFLGPNGAGKSTTIKVLTGQLPLKGGRAQILGRDIGRDDSEMQAHIGVTFEEKNLYLEMTALENLNFFASLFGIRNPGSLEALKRVGLADRARDRVSQYSKGMRQRLMIARAFINKPSVLFLDEPTDGLDPVTASAIRKTIKEEAERGAAVLLTTHNMFEADELSNRVAFINEGEIVALDTAENLKLKYGKRSVLVRLRDRDGVREEELPLDGEKSSARLGKLAASPDLMTIHTEEATLEKIFIRLTGRGLAG
ncbi:MAG: ATP-binding cassette domain-containing protein [Bacillota bacterium]|nr:ATP-binding cassette domain-containing protein [Bacillota bacterium]MDW7728643.1 ATP-binding cassette domain-containing protein [Bacillota bacterium]